jgi:N-acetylneuraminic acid mutarotase
MSKSAKHLVSLLVLMVCASAVSGAITTLGTPVKPQWTGNQDAPVYFDTVRVYGAPYRAGTIREAAIGTKFKGASDDTVRFATVMSAAPRYVLLMQDTTTVAPLKRDSLGWRRNGTNVRYFDSGPYGYQGVAVGDVDGDYRTDIVYGRAASPYSIWRGWWDGSTWQRESLPVAPFPSPTNEIAIGDANNDGRNEILIGSGGNLFRLDSSGSAWTRESLVGGIGTCYGVAIGDFDAAYPGNEVAIATSARFMRVRWNAGVWDTMTILATGGVVSFNDVAIGDFDPDNAGNEVAVYNGLGFANYGNFFLFSGSGNNWNLTQLLAYVGWASLGELAVGDVLDTHIGAEIVAVPGGIASNPILTYKSGGAWYAYALPMTGGTSYGIDIGNVNKWRSPVTNSQEMIITGATQVFEYEQRLLLNYDLTASNLMFPNAPTAVVGSPVSVRMTIKNLGYTTQTSIPVRYQIGANPVVNETWNCSLPVGASADYTFTTQFTPAADGGLPVKAWTDLTNEQYRADDTLSDSLQVFVTGTVVGQLFNRTAFPPFGWQTILGPTAAIQWARATTSSSPPGYLPEEGAGMARYACPSQPSPYGARLWSHKFNVGSQPRDVVVGFWMLNTSQFGANYDSLCLEYSTDSLTWTTSSGWRAYDATNPLWNKKTITVGSFPANQNLWIGFRSRSDAGHDICVDSVRAYTAPPTANFNDVGVTRITLPQPMLVGSPYPVAIKIRNYGLSAQSAFPVMYDAGPGLVTEAWSGTLAPGDTVNYTFTQNYTPPDTGLHRMWASTALTGDQHQENDSISLPFRVCVTYHTADYVKDFEEAWSNSTNPPFCGWSIIDGGTETPPTIDGNDWQKADIGGPQYGVAEILSQPVETSNDWLVSPRFDCSLAGVYTLSYWHDYADWSHATLDSGNVLISTDGGTTWPVRVARYSNASSSGEATFKISAYVSGQANVKVAFWYVATDENYWDVDDFTLTYVPTPPTPALYLPANHATGVSTTPTFVWGAGTFGSFAPFSFHLVVDNDSLFSTPAIDVWQAETSYTATSPLATGTYYWHVIAKDTAGNTGAWSSRWDFATRLTDTGWSRKADVPLGPKSKRVKDGACLAYCGEGDSDYVYMLKGNNRLEFYKYNTQSNLWTAKESIPAIGAAGKKKAVKKGGALAQCTVSHKLYATKGNNTLDFWQYDPGLKEAQEFRSSGVQEFRSSRFTSSDEYPWTQKANVPTGMKNLKEGTGAVSVQSGDTNYIYLLKGSATTEFYRYNTMNNTWETRENAPLGGSNKPYKNGSALAYDGSFTIYALKGSYNEFFTYNCSTNAWTSLVSLPLIGTGGKKKKVKDGAGIAYAGGKVYAMKGGNTSEFWTYTVDSHRWAQYPDVPPGTGKRVKGGGAIVYAASAHGLYVTKGNNTFDFFRYGLSAYSSQLAAYSPNVLSNSPLVTRHSSLSVAPNPFTNATLVSYTLPRPGNVSLKLYDVTGKLVNTLASGYRNAGTSSFIVPRSSLSSGIYLLKLEVDNTIATEKLIIE